MRKKRITLLIIIIALIIIMGIGTYAFFTADIAGNVDQDNIVQTTGNLKIEYSEGQNIDAEKIRPGWIGTKTFTIKNTGTLSVNYDIVFADLVNTFINDEVIYRGYCNSNQGDCGEIPEDVIDSVDFYIEYSITIEPEEEHEYEIEIEFIETGTNQNYNNNANLSGKISVYETGALRLKIKPTVDIVDNMIPVAWDGSTLIKVDKENHDNNWYDYDNQKWANAVLVTDASRETIKSASAGTTIAESNILAYYTYIPRYRYQLWNTNHNENCLNDNCAEQEIKVEFERKTTPKSLGSQNGEWLTHPAFTFGESELNGIWVGKFTTSVDPSTNCYSSPSEANCNNKTRNPRVKPNMDMWRYTQVSTMFSVSKKIETELMYGLSTHDNVNSHLMRNMEWGAVAYLSHSKYGKYGNEDFNGTDKQLYINNYRRTSADAYKTETGCSGGAPSTAQNSSSCPHPYPGLTTEALGASTTGNIYGIYDMSGGVWEYVMGNMVANGSPLGTFHAYSPSGTWDYTPDSKYYESYAYDTDFLSHERGYLGDSTKETLLEFGTNENGGWYSDNSRFPGTTSVWFLRGGHANSGSSAGAFAFSCSLGGSAFNIGFRVVLTLE